MPRTAAGQPVVGGGGAERKAVHGALAVPAAPALRGAHIQSVARGAAKPPRGFTLGQAYAVEVSHGMQRSVWTKVGCQVPRGLAIRPSLGGVSCSSVPSR